MSVSSDILLSRKEKLDSLKDELREFLIDPQFGGTLAERNDEPEEDHRGFVFSAESGNIHNGLPVIMYEEGWEDAGFASILAKHNAGYEWYDAGTAHVFLWEVFN